MKNTIFLAFASLFFSFAASAQTDTSKLTTTSDIAKADKYNNFPAATFVTLDSNLPDHLKGTTSSTLEPKHFLPILGSYAAAVATPATPATTAVAPATEAAPVALEATVHVTVDEKNLGIVWIDGLPQGRIKAMLKKSPSTYKIPAQKTEEGKSVAEGTLIYDKDAKVLWVAIGAPYNEENPSAPFTAEKTKAKVSQFTRVEPVAPAAAPVTTEQQMQQQ